MILKNLQSTLMTVHQNFNFNWIFKKQYYSKKAKYHDSIFCVVLCPKILQFHAPRKVKTPLPESSCEIHSITRPQVGKIKMLHWVLISKFLASWTFIILTKYVVWVQLDFLDFSDLQLSFVTKVYGGLMAPLAYIGSKMLGLNRWIDYISNL